MHRRHHGSGDSLPASLPHRHIDAIRQVVLHIPIVHLLHIGFVLQIWCDEILIIIVPVLLKIIEIVPRNTRNILQVVE